MPGITHQTFLRRIVEIGRARGPQIILQPPLRLDSNELCSMCRAVCERLCAMKLLPSHRQVQQPVEVDPSRLRRAQGVDRCNSFG